MRTFSNIVGLLAIMLLCSSGVTLFITNDFPFMQFGEGLAVVCVWLILDRRASKIEQEYIQQPTKS